jgi:hypothetical protein
LKGQTGGGHRVRREDRLLPKARVPTGMRNQYPEVLPA